RGIRRCSHGWLQPRGVSGRHWLGTLKKYILFAVKSTMPRHEKGERQVGTSRDFWLSCGHHLLDRDAAGRLLVTDEFLKVYLARPELVPPPEACAAERAL